MLESGVSQLAEWSSMLGHHNLRVSVNVSALELGVDGMLLDRVSEVLSRHTVRSDQLILEVTESAVASNPHLASRVLARLRDLGVHVALDDFGTGHSSLSRLREFPIEYLKLDGALIAGIEHDETQALILRSITDLGRGLNMTVIAEGVATSSQLAHVRGLSPSLFLQGFALSPPAAAQDLTRTLIRGADLARFTAIH
jgi:EAL domain-containing protein (putative c-di-GMP-specific phosphodiesterase class I)